MPSTTVLKIKAVFGAIDRFTGPLAGMQRRMARFKRVAGGVARAMKRAGRAVRAFGRLAASGLKVGLLAAAGAVTALGVSIFKMTENMDTLAKTTRALNFPIEEFQEFRFAAEQSGVSTEVFNKSIKKFSKGIGEAKAGTGTMVTILRKSNPELLKQLTSTENVADAFDIYLKAIRDIKNPMDKAALSSAAFGRAGVDMINLANLSQKDLGALRAQMRENGVVTQEQAELAEEFNDTMNRVKLTVMGVFRDVVVPLIPKLTKWAEKFRKWAVANRELIKTKVTEWAIKFKNALVKVWTWFKQNQPAIEQFISDLASFAKGVANFVRGLWDFKDSLLLVAAAFVSIKVAMAGMQLAQTATNLTAMGGAAAKAAPAVGGLSKVLGKGGLITAAAAAGVAVGLLINKLVDKSEKADRAARNSAVQLQRGLGGASLKELQGRKASLERKRQKTDTLGGFASDVIASGGLTGYLLGLNTENKDALKEISDANKAINAEIARRVGGVGPTAQAETPAPLAPPQSSTSSTTTTTTERTELTIKDETGRTEITKGGTNGTVKLVPTGAMAN